MKRKNQRKTREVFSVSFPDQKAPKKNQLQEKLKVLLKISILLSSKVLNESVNNLLLMKTNIFGLCYVVMGEKSLKRLPCFSP